MRKIPRRLARAPISLFKAGLGWVFGGVLVMVEHTGRTSGLRRYVVLEVVIPEAGAVVVAAGYGRRSQWFRNIVADPRVRLWRGGVVGVRAVAEVLPPAEARALLERYRREHPLRARFVARALGIEGLTSADPLPADVGERVPLVRVAAVPR
ncbi:nitroreductase family deazaflavin-dependent oxidoreductase [Georgenia subflava]|uniref:Nitroreductase family deazaflavin-dependent oxidoreductase n=1 Tax=Georgenia subflava TaxID=1622177 RepID=A0A6N7EH58_9MICO|nr:nitroreductase family deazaflavin-dependent oxidoreductase [Georgenia subflava]MPV37702.1 nitroreductase family deazaflavin-dependent oxidoreductase [Georgenia subflava]